MTLNSSTKRNGTEKKRSNSNLVENSYKWINEAVFDLCDEKFLEIYEYLLKILLFKQSLNFVYLKGKHTNTSF